MKAPADWKWPQERNAEEDHDHQFMFKYMPTTVNCYYLMLDARIPGVMCNFLEFDGTMPQMKLSDMCRVVDNRNRKYQVIEVSCAPPPDWVTRIKKMTGQGYTLPLSDDGKRLMEARLRGERGVSKKKAEETSTEEKVEDDKEQKVEVPAKAAKNGGKNKNAAAAPKGKAAAAKGKAPAKAMKKDAKGKAKAPPMKKGKTKSKDTLLPPEGEEDEEDEEQAEGSAPDADEGSAPDADADAKQIAADLSMGKEIAKKEVLFCRRAF